MWKFTKVLKSRKRKQNKYNLDGCWWDDINEIERIFIFDIHIKIDYVCFCFFIQMRVKMPNREKKRKMEKKKHANMFIFLVFLLRCLVNQSQLFCFYFYDDAEIIQILQRVHAKILCVCVHRYLFRFVIRFRKSHRIRRFLLARKHTRESDTTSPKKTKFWLKIRKAIVCVWVTECIS